MTFFEIIGIVGVALAVVLFVNLLWRWASRRRSLPCPTCFAWFLESRLLDRLIGTSTTLERIGLKPGQRVLEVGPGPGRLLIPAAQRVSPDGEVVGVDIQQGMIKRLKARAERADITNLTAILGDAIEAHVAPNQFDVAFLCTVLGEIPDRVTALRQCHTALNSGGVLSITEIFPDPHFQPRSTVIRLADEADFTLKEMHGRWYFFTANFVTKEDRKE